MDCCIQYGENGFDLAMKLWTPSILSHCDVKCHFYTAPVQTANTNASREEALQARRNGNLSSNYG